MKGTCVCAPACGPLSGSSTQSKGITTQQDILLGDIDPANRSGIDALLTEYGIPRPENLSLVRKLSMACPAIPTCGLARLTEVRTVCCFGRDR